MHVRGHANVLKRLLVHASACKLGLWMRMLFGVGTPRSLQGHLMALGALLSTLWSFIDDAMIPRAGASLDSTTSSRPVDELVFAESFA